MLGRVGRYCNNILYKMLITTFGLAQLHFIFIAHVYFDQRTRVGKSNKKKSLKDVI